MEQQSIFNENHTAPYPSETSVSPVLATGRFVYRKSRRTRPFQLIHPLVVPTPDRSGRSVREQTILFLPGGTRHIREYEKELPPPALTVLPSPNGNKSLISAAFLPSRKLRWRLGVCTRTL